MSVDQGGTPVAQKITVVLRIWEYQSLLSPLEDSLTYLIKIIGLKFA